MPKFRFDTSVEGREDEPWTKLATISEALESGDPVPSHLAQWFSQAVQYAKGDNNEFLRRLGLKQGRGQAKSDEWVEWGRRVHLLEARNETPEAAINAALDEYAVEHEGEAPSRSTLQRWRDRYREALADAARP